MGLIACGGSSAQPDAATSQNSSLVILDPPGDSIGLPFGGSITLRVAYLDAGGEPMIGAPLKLQMLSGPGEDPGGSTLSANEATTDALGIAEVNLLAGAERTNFRVEVSAANAPSAWFYVAVSEDGFADLKITPVHHGWRPVEQFERVELRRFRGSELRCIDLDIDDLQPSFFPPRSLPGFTGTVTFQNVSVGGDYTIVAWATVPSSTSPIAVGCVDLGVQQVVAGPVLFDLMVADRAAALPASAHLESAIDLAPVAAATAALDLAWQILSCPDGPGQLVLSCTLDGLVPDDALDCVVTAGGAVVEAVEAHRGPPDGDGCRPALVGSDDSLDHRLTAAIAAGGSWPVADDLATLLAARRDALAGFTLTSELTFVSARAARHRLSRLSLAIGESDFSIDLTESDRPLVEAGQVAIAIADRTLDLGAHGFSLRYGSAAAAAFRALGLAPAGLGDRAADLGAALVESTYDGDSGGSGCLAVSAILCDAIGDEPGCALTGCADARATLDVDLAAWTHRLDGTDLDLSLTGTAPLYDFDDDLSVDAIGTDEGEVATGSWSVELTLADGTVLSTVGGFGSVD